MKIPNHSNERRKNNSHVEKSFKTSRSSSNFGENKNNTSKIKLNLDLKKTQKKNSGVNSITKKSKTLFKGPYSKSKSYTSLISAEISLFYCFLYMSKIKCPSLTFFKYFKLKLISFDSLKINVVSIL